MGRGGYRGPVPTDDHRDRAYGAPAVRLGADPDQLERLASQHEVCAAHLARVRTRLRRADRGAWRGPGAARGWSHVDDRLVPDLVAAGNHCSAAARHLRSQAREQRRASLADPRLLERRDGTAWIARLGPVDAELAVVIVRRRHRPRRPPAARDAGRVWEWLTARIRTAGTGRVPDVAVVAWLGYRPPANLLAGLDASAAQTAHPPRRRRGRCSRAPGVAVVGTATGRWCVARRRAGMGPMTPSSGNAGTRCAVGRPLALPPGGRVWRVARGDPSAARQGPARARPRPAEVALALPTSLPVHGASVSVEVLLAALSAALLGRGGREGWPAAGTFHGSAPGAHGSGGRPWEPQSPPTTVSPRS